MKASVIVFPGSNCDRDVQVALGQSLRRQPDMVWHGEAEIPETDLIVVPGGFSYGDYLRSGAMAAQSPVMRDVVAKAKKGVPVLGICNGFQVLTECGLLPGALMRNAGLKFVCRDVHLSVEETESVFTGGYEKGQVIRIPIAHHDEGADLGPCYAPAAIFGLRQEIAQGVERQPRCSVFDPLGYAGHTAAFAVDRAVARPRQYLRRRTRVFADPVSLIGPVDKLSRLA